VHPKTIQTLFPTDILFQTACWSRFASRLGWKPIAFDFQSSSGEEGDILALIRPLGFGFAAAYVPQGPESNPEPDQYGRFLESLSQALTRHLDSTVAFIRYDLPWESPYAAETAIGHRLFEHPEPRLRELRMNFGTRTWNLRKAVSDLTVADALIIDVARDEENIMSTMKPKTRYNIRLARRKGVRVFHASIEMLPLFYDLYLQTARRNRFQPATYRHLLTLFSTFDLNSRSSEILFLLAARGQDILAGAIVAISERRAVYLFGASANRWRDLMGPYAVHWEAIKWARRRRCLTYDMGSVSPNPDPIHPFYGMYRFKTGFGGTVIHRNGSWDYPIDMRRYNEFRNYESLVRSMPVKANMTFDGKKAFSGAGDGHASFIHNETCPPAVSG